MSQIASDPFAAAFDSGRSAPPAPAAAPAGDPFESAYDEFASAYDKMLPAKLPEADPVEHAKARLREQAGMGPVPGEPDVGPVPEQGIRPLEPQGWFDPNASSPFPESFQRNVAAPMANAAVNALAGAERHIYKLGLLSPLTAPAAQAALAMDPQGAPLVGTMVAPGDTRRVLAANDTAEGQVPDAARAVGGMLGSLPDPAQVPALAAGGLGGKLALRTAAGPIEAVGEGLASKLGSKLAAAAQRIIEHLTGGAGGGAGYGAAAKVTEIAETDPGRLLSDPLGVVDEVLEATRGGAKVGAIGGAVSGTISALAERRPASGKVAGSKAEGELPAKVPEAETTVQTPDQLPALLPEAKPVEAPPVALPDSAPAAAAESTSPKNAAMAADREALGLDALPEAQRRGFETALADAKARGLPERAQFIAADVLENPRSLTDAETAGVTVRAAELKNQHREATAAVGAAKGDPAEIKFRAAELSRIEDEFDQLSRALRASGTEAGRQLAIRRLAIDQDYDLLSVVNRATAAKGKPLSAFEQGGISKLVSKLEDIDRRAVGTEELSPRITLGTRAVAKLDEIENAALERLRSRSIPRGRSVGATTLPDDIVDAAIVLAARGAKAGIRAGEAMNRFVAENLKVVAPHLRTEDVQGEASKQLAALSRLPDLSEAGAKARIEKQIAGMNASVAAGLKPRASKSQPLGSQELERLRLQRDILRRQINDRIDALKPRTFWGKVAEPFNFARAVRASVDFSAVLRQGGMIAFGHPVRAAMALPAMLRAAGSELGLARVNKEILDRPNAPLYARAKLALTDVGGKLANQEEVFMSRLAAKTPLVAGSQRAYTAYLNRLRADSFDAMVETLGRRGEVTQAEAHAIANYVNVATGRGSLGVAEQAAPTLASVFFAPRLVASRFQLLAGQPLMQGTMRTRAMIAGEYARMLGGLGVVYGLANLGGASVEWDPRSSDFGKIRFGETRIDPLAGLAQVTRLGTKLTLGERKTAAGEIVPIRGDNVPYGGETTTSAIATFLRTKLSPIPGAAIDALQGKNVVGEKVTPAGALGSSVTPISLENIYDALRAHDVDEATALGILSVFGMGVESRKPK